MTKTGASPIAITASGISTTGTLLIHRFDELESEDRVKRFLVENPYRIRDNKNVVISDHWSYLTMFVHPFIHQGRSFYLEITFNFSWLLDIERNLASVARNLYI